MEFLFYDFHLSISARKAALRNLSLTPAQTISEAIIDIFHSNNKKPKIIILIQWQRKAI